MIAEHAQECMEKGGPLGVPVPCSWDLQRPPSLTWHSRVLP